MRVEVGAGEEGRRVAVLADAHHGYGEAGVAEQRVERRVVRVGGLPGWEVRGERVDVFGRDGRAYEKRCAHEPFVRTVVVRRYVPLVDPDDVQPRPGYVEGGEPCVEPAYRRPPRHAEHEGRFLGGRPQRLGDVERGGLGGGIRVG